MHQSITPSLSQTIWPRWASRQFLSVRIVQTLLSVTFGYSLCSEAVVMRQLRRRKMLWRRSLTRTHKRIPWGLPEVVGKGQQVHCSRRRLLRRGLEFHVCTINKRTHSKKVCKLILRSCTNEISADMSFGLVQVFHIELGNLHGSSNWNLYLIHTTLYCFEYFYLILIILWCRYSNSHFFVHCYKVSNNL